MLAQSLQTDKKNIHFYFFLVMPKHSKYSFLGSKNARMRLFQLFCSRNAEANATHAKNFDQISNRSHRAHFVCLCRDFDSFMEVDTHQC